MTAIFGTIASSSMDIKHEMIYRDDDVLLVKSETANLSPCPPTTSNGLSAILAGATTNNGGLVAAGSSTSMATVSNGLSGVVANGPFSALAVASSGGGGSGTAKRTRTDDWLSSPTAQRTISGIGPPLTPSPGPPNTHQFTVISNGYSSPMSSGSYDPYSPNDKSGKLAAAGASRLS